MDGGELATDRLVVDDLLEGCPHLLHASDALVLEGIVDRILALVTPGRAASAVFQNLEDDVHIQLPPL